jgi:hypothetical protein
MHCLLAHVNARPTKTGVSFNWSGGAWEYDQMSGSGSVRLGKDGRLRGKLRIKNGVAIGPSGSQRGVTVARSS